MFTLVFNHTVVYNSNFAVIKFTFLIISIPFEYFELNRVLGFIVYIRFIHHGILILGVKTSDCIQTCMWFFIIFSIVIFCIWIWICIWIRVYFRILSIFRNQIPFPFQFWLTVIITIFIDFWFLHKYIFGWFSLITHYAFIAIWTFFSFFLDIDFWIFFFIRFPCIFLFNLKFF